MLVALIAACWAAQPAAAVELPAVGQVATAVTEQVPTEPPKPAAETAVEAVATVQARVQQTVAAAAQQVPAAPALPDAPAAPAMSAKPAEQGQSGPAPARERPTARVSSARVEPSPPRGSRLRATLSDPAAESLDLRPTAAAAPSDGRIAAAAHGSAPHRAAAPSPQEDRPGGPDRPGPAQGGAAASAGSAAFFFGGLALLVGAFALAGPRLRRRLVIRPASWRPIGLVLLLERPG